MTTGPRIAIASPYALKRSRVARKITAAAFLVTVGVIVGVAGYFALSAISPTPVPGPPCRL